MTTKKGANVQLKKTFFYSVILISSIFLSACGGQDSSDAVKEPEVAVKQDGPQPDYNGRMPDDPIYMKPEWPREIRKETYGDPEIFSTPRVQFLARLYGDNLFERQEDKSLWSMRPDGSDRRLVATREEITYQGGGVFHTPIRSPNNRYVALSLADKDLTYYRGILDLKTREKWIIHQGGGRPSFNWTSDSENLIFHSDNELYNYHLPTRTLTKRPIIYSKGLFLLPGDQEFLAFKGNGFWIHKFNGELVRKVEFDIEPDGGGQDKLVSPDGKLFYFTTSGGEVYLVDIETSKLLKKSDKQTFIGTTYIPLFLNSKTLYIYMGRRYRLIDLVSEKKDTFNMNEWVIWSMTGEQSLTIFNHQIDK